MEMVVKVLELRFFLNLLFLIKKIIFLKLLYTNNAERRPFNRDTDIEV